MLMHLSKLTKTKIKTSIEKNGKAGVLIYSETVWMDAATFDDADTNGDKIVSISEFRESFSKTNCFASYDARTDGQINVQEMSRQLFKNLDKNGDGAIDEKEFQPYNPLEKRK